MKHYLHVFSIILQISWVTLVTTNVKPQCHLGYALGYLKLDLYTYSWYSTSITGSCLHTNRTLENCHSLFISFSGLIEFVMQYPRHVPSYIGILGASSGSYICQWICVLVHKLEGQFLNTKSPNVEVLRTIVFVDQGRLRAEVLRPPNSTRTGFELITSRSWHYIHSFTLGPFNLLHIVQSGVGTCRKWIETKHLHTFQNNHLRR